MNYTYTLTFGLGGLGLLRRGFIAIVILLIMKNLDKTEPAYGKALKWILIIGVVAILLGVLLWGIFAGLMGAMFINPFFFWDF